MNIKVNVPQKRETETFSFIEIRKKDRFYKWINSVGEIDNNYVIVVLSSVPFLVSTKGRERFICISEHNHWDKERFIVATEEISITLENKES